MRDVLKGISDTFENLLQFTLFSLGWWLALFLIVPAPGATLALLAATDPRAVHASSRPDWNQAVSQTRHFLQRGWSLVAIAIPVLGIAAWNLWTFPTAIWAVLTPLWVAVLLGGGALLMLTATCTGLFDLPLREGVRTAGVVLVRRPLGLLIVVVPVALLLALSTALVVPLFLFFPALASSVLNRFVLHTLDIPVADPLEPSPERLAEAARQGAAKRFGP